MSVHVIEAKLLLLDVCSNTSSPSIWHMKSLHITEAKFLLRKVYYYIESQYLTPWYQCIWLRQSFHCWRSVLLHWVPVCDTIRSVHITEAKVLLLEVSTTTLSPSIWHNEVSTHDWDQDSTDRGRYYFIESQYLTIGVSTHPWGQVYPDTGQYYNNESQYLIQLCRCIW